MTTVITTAPRPWARRTRAAEQAVTAVLLLAAHLAVAVIVLAIRIPYTLLGMAARTAARLELRLSAATGRPPLGQTAGVALAGAFAAEFRAAYHQPTR